MQLMFDLTGRIALVTGSGQNVGAGIARALVGQGAVVVVNDFHADRAERIASELNESGGHAIAVPFDVTDFAAVSDGVQQISTRVGAIDVLINNAGTGGPHTPMPMAQFTDTQPADWEPIVAVNLFGPMNCAKTVLPSMLSRNWGRIITMSSGAGQIGMNIGVSPYAAGKAGAAGFMRHLAVETAPHGVTVNTISLGLVLEDASGVEGLAKTIPAGRLGKPEDVGAFTFPPTKRRG
jgi:NAD(P)-dependent dehydrogenase (short-subunit alcohol dehydrogenase family)